MGFIIGTLTDIKDFPKDYDYPAPTKSEKELKKRRKSLKGRFLWPGDRVFQFCGNCNTPIRGRVAYWNDKEDFFGVHWDPDTGLPDSSHYATDPYIYTYEEKK